MSPEAAQPRHPLEQIVGMNGLQAKMFIERMMYNMSGEGKRKIDKTEVAPDNTDQMVPNFSQPTESTIPGTFREQNPFPKAKRRKRYLIDPNSEMQGVTMSN